MLIQGFSNQYEVFKKFCSGIFKCLIMHGYFQSHVHHIKSIHAHPTRSIGLFQPHISGHLNAPVKNSNIIKAKEATLENIIATGILSVDPPREINNELL